MGFGSSESNYVAGSDVEDKRLQLTIRELREEEVGQKKDRKWVMYFQGQDKGLVMNKTNSKTLIRLYGEPDDIEDHKSVTAQYRGKPITRYFNPDTE